MNQISYKNHELTIENMSLAKLTQEIETPFYCYSQTAIEQAYQNYEHNLSLQNKTICYAIKANSNQAVIKTLADLGAGADVVSEGELRRALKAGIPANKIVYSGVAKTSKEMKFALEKDIFQFNVESENELEQLNQVAASLGVKAPIAFRINPDVDAKTHAKISTGLSENKFGIPISRAVKVYQKAHALPHIDVQGVDVHIGSQLTQLSPFKNAFLLIRDLVTELNQLNIPISVIDVGGGLGINYNETEKLNFSDSQNLQEKKTKAYCRIVEQCFGDLGCKIILEPGRSLVGQSGLLVSRVIYKKQGEERKFIIIDAAMNDLLRPSMYDAFHDIHPLNKGNEQEVVDIVGPVCETGDTFAKNREIATLNQGDYLAIGSCGAYGAVMASSYNTRLMVPEVLIKDDQFAIVKSRIDYDELINQDQLANWQQDSKLDSVA